MKKYRSILTAIAASTMVSSLSADTFVLTDGTKIKGEIVSSTIDSYVIRAEVSPGIRNNRTVKKVLVEKIIKEDKSIAAYEGIKNTLPAPDLLAAEDYQRAIDEKIAPFLKEFPTSKFVTQVEKMKSALENEMKQIQNGGVKLDGKIITPEERALNQYEIDARLQYAQMAQFAQSRAFGPAMQKFETLEKDYKATIFFNKALDLAKQLLPVYHGELSKMSTEADALVEKRRITLDRLDSGNRARAEKLLEQEDADYKAQLAEAKSARLKFYPTNRFDKKQIDSNIKVVEREMARIDKIKVSDVDAGAAYREILVHLDKNETKEASEKLREFKSGRPPKNYSDELYDKIKQVETTMRDLEAEQRREALEIARKAREAKLKAAREKNKK